MSDAPAPLPPAGPARRAHLVPPALLAGLWLLSFALGLAGERIPVNGGLGYDGVIYGHLAADFRGAFPAITRERAQRVLPALVVHLGLAGAGVEARVAPHHVSPALVHGFALLNLLLLGVGLLLWQRVLVALSLGPGARALACALLGVSFMGLKLPFYAPVLTDTAGLVLAIAALLAYLRGRSGLLAVTLVLAAFTWPTLTWSGALLLALPRSPGEQRPGLAPLGLGVALSVAALLAAFAAGNVLHHGPGRPPAALEDELPVHLASLPLGVAALALYLGLGGGLLLGAPGLISWRGLQAQVRWPLLAGAALALVGWQALLRTLDLPPGRSVLDLMLLDRDAAVSRGVRLPLLFLVAHVAFFGPAALIAVAHFRGVCAEAWSHGAGLTLFLFLGLVTGVTSESRHVVHVYPFLAALTAAAAGREGDRRAWALAGLALGVGLLGSRLWVPMSDPARLRDYFELFGPWMPVATYLEQGALCLGVLALAVWLRRRPA